MIKDRQLIKQNLFESLASISIISCVDRDTVLTTPFPNPEKLLVFNDKLNLLQIDIQDVGNRNGDLKAGSVLDHNNQSGFRIRGTANNMHSVSFMMKNDDKKLYVNNLKPFGLSVLLNSRCLTRGHRKENHRKLTLLSQFW
jgi:hypothetical protein